MILILILRAIITSATYTYFHWLYWYYMIWPLRHWWYCHYFRRHTAFTQYCWYVHYAIDVIRYHCHYFTLPLFKTLCLHEYITLYAITLHSHWYTFILLRHYIIIIDIDVISLIIFLPYTFFIITDTLSLLHYYHLMLPFLRHDFFFSHAPFTLPLFDYAIIYYMIAAILE